jgi:SpoVK/Ycf46/Vps4 family AAA+-type ATPase
VLLQAIDTWPSTSLLVAATNHPELLDPAVWRRFDLQLPFENPSTEAIESFLHKEGIDPSVASELAHVLRGVSYADLRRIVLSARKISILADCSFEIALIDEAVGETSLGEGSNLLRSIMIRKLATEGLSQRRIAEKLGISHPTVGRVLKDLKRD